MPFFYAIIFTIFLLAKLELLIFTQGGPEDIAFKNGQETVRAFKENGFNCEYFEAPGGHTWFTWRYNLRDLTPRLFK